MRRSKPASEGKQTLAKKHNRILEAFYQYRDVLVRTLVRMSVAPADVDDILQETLARTIDADQTNSIEFPKSYLFSVSRNMVLREQKRKSREVLTSIDEAIADENAHESSDDLYYRQMLAVFWAAMDSLPQAQRRAIMLRRIYGLSQKEVAEKMNVSVSSVEKYFAQGIRRCQDTMKNKGFDVSDMAQTGRATKKALQVLERKKK
ncbi:RNA polymerase sigma factor [Porticoccus sp. GXU_MW_L64]